MSNRVSDMEELFLRALFWIAEVSSSDEYVSLLHEIYMKPENEDNDLLFRLEENTKDPIATFHIVFGELTRELNDDKKVVDVYTDMLRRRFEETHSVLEVLRVVELTINHLSNRWTIQSNPSIVKLHEAIEYSDFNIFSRQPSYKRLIDIMYSDLDDKQKNDLVEKAIEDDTGAIARRAEETRSRNLSDVNAGVNRKKKRSFLDKLMFWRR